MMFRHWGVWRGERRRGDWGVRLDWRHRAGTIGARGGGRRALVKERLLMDPAELAMESLLSLMEIVGHDRKCGAKLQARSICPSELGLGSFTTQAEEFPQPTSGCLRVRQVLCSWID